MLKVRRCHALPKSSVMLGCFNKVVPTASALQWLIPAMDTPRQMYTQ